MTKPNSSLENLTFEKMTLDDLIVAYDYAAAEGWNPCVGIAKAVYKIDPDGFWVCKIDNEVVGTAGLIVYQKFYAFIGMFIIKPAYRGGLLGYKLIQYAADKARTRGAVACGCDAVPENIHKYEQLGFKLHHFMTRYQCRVKSQLDISKICMDVTEREMDRIAQFIIPYEPEPRPLFVHEWHKCKNVRSLIVEDQGAIQAFGSICRTTNGFRIGPLYANNVDAALNIVTGLLADQKEGDLVHIDVPDINKYGHAFAKRLGMEPVWALGRMYYGIAPQFNIENVYGTWLAETG